MLTRSSELQERKAALLQAVGAIYAFAADPDRYAELIAEIANFPNETTGFAEDLAALLTPYIGENRATALDGAPYAVLYIGHGPVIIGHNGRLPEFLNDIIESLEPGAPLNFRHSENEERWAEALLRISNQTDETALLQFFDGSAHCLRLGLMARPDAVLNFDHALQMQAQHVILFPERAPDLEVEKLLRDGWNLSKAEAHLALLLENGLSLHEAAQKLDLSIHTVRNQLKSIFDKMHIGRQSELIRTIVDLTTLARYLPQDAPQADGRAPHFRTLTSDIPKCFTLPDGRTLQYRDYGPRDGRVIHYFHLWAGIGILPPGTDALLHRLGLRIIAVNRPGYEGSSPIRRYSAWSVAQDIALFSNGLDIENFDILAFAGSTAFALATAIHMDERVGRITLVSPRAPARHRFEQDIGTDWQRYRSYVSRFPKLMDGLTVIFARLATRHAVKRIVDGIIAKCPADRDFFEQRPDMYNFVLQNFLMGAKYSIQGIAAELRHMAQDMTPDPADVKQPIVVWHDSHDPIVPYDTISAYIARAPNIAIRLFTGTGHYLIWRRWEELLQNLAQKP